MKKLFTLVTLLAAVAFVGCNKQNEEVGETKFTLAQVQIEVAADGGAQVVEYTITNPQQGAVVITNCKADWIKNLSAATVGQLKFTVAPNYSQSERETVITVQYTAISQKYEITIKQQASDKPMFVYDVVVNEPSRLSLNVTPANLTTAFICRAYTEEHIDAFYLYDDEALVTYDLEAIEYEAYFMGQSFLNYLQNISNVGKSFDIEFTRLFPDTNYVVYCYHIDLTTGEVCSDVYRETIRTAKPMTEEFDVDVKLEVSGAVITQTITPADKEVYYYTGCWDVNDFYRYYGMDAVMEETLVAKWNESVSLAINNGYYAYQHVDANCFKGDKVIVYDTLRATTDYVFFIFSVDRETGFASSNIIIMEQRTNEAHASDMTITIEAKNIFQRTADVYWTASDPNGKFARSVMTKAEFEAHGANDDEKLERFVNDYWFYQAYGSTDMNLSNLTPNTTYVAFAYGLDGEAPNTRIFKTEFTTLSDTPGMSNISLNWDTHYNMVDVAAADAEHWGDYAGYDTHTLAQINISGVNTSDDVYIMITTRPWDYYNNMAEWLRDVAQEQNKVNLYSTMNYVAEYEKEYTVVAVAKDAAGNYGELFKETMILFASDDMDVANYSYIANN